jgi:hypothetical protein
MKSHASLYRIATSLVCLTAAAGLWVWSGCGDQPAPETPTVLYTGIIQDAESGERIAASVHITGLDGQTIVPVNTADSVRYLGKVWYYQDGVVTIPDAPEVFTIELRRGHEYLPLAETVDTRAGVQGTFALRRWTHMLEQGWLSGDTHIHYLSQKSTMLRMQAEDLRVGNLLVSDFTHDREKFIGKLDPVSTPEWQLYVGQEFRDWDLGHINLLRVREIVEPFEPYGGEFNGKGDDVNYVVTRVARAAHEQDAVVTFAHFSDIPGIETPIMVANDDLDALDLITQSDPMGPVKHKRPWLYGGMSPSEFPEKRGIDLWYTFLNAGLDIPVSAGTDRMNDRIPIGSLRHYVKYSGNWNYDTWVEGVREGNGFITNAPMLDFQVENWSPGHKETFSSTRPRKFFTRVTAGSILPFDRLEIIRNGAVVAATDIPPQQDMDGVYRAHLALPIDVEESSWLAARAVSERDSSNMILPRNHTVFAHTNPIVVELGEEPVQQESARQYLAAWVRAALHFADTRAKFKTPEEFSEFRQLARRALVIYGALSEEPVEAAGDTVLDGEAAQ